MGKNANSAKIISQVSPNSKIAKIPQLVRIKRKSGVWMTLHSSLTQLTADGLVVMSSHIYCKVRQVGTMLLLQIWPYLRSHLRNPSTIHMLGPIPLHPMDGDNPSPLQFCIICFYVLIPEAKHIIIRRHSSKSTFIDHNETEGITGQVQLQPL